ncbi:hypothetical protein K438DRAFT_1760773 [Mycena galopus ATCC 62051]|nr:hypothetical protein K438DRAFT_1760773 [Mycena galopus ATCC 62051]
MFGLIHQSKQPLGAKLGRQELYEKKLFEAIFKALNVFAHCFSLKDAQEIGPDAMEKKWIKLAWFEQANVVHVFKPGKWMDCGTGRILPAHRVTPAASHLSARHPAPPSLPQPVTVCSHHTPLTPHASSSPRSQHRVTSILACNTTPRVVIQTVDAATVHSRTVAYALRALLLYTACQIYVHAPAIRLRAVFPSHHQNSIHGSYRVSDPPKSMQHAQFRHELAVKGSKTPRPPRQRAHRGDERSRQTAKQCK